eukprot:scaffold549_cov385-Prasinococcus_capsulatus_cf.AAC.29
MATASRPWVSLTRESHEGKHVTPRRASLLAAGATYIMQMEPEEETLDGKGQREGGIAGVARQNGCGEDIHNATAASRKHIPCAMS